MDYSSYFFGIHGGGVDAHSRRRFRRRGEDITSDFSTRVLGLKNALDDPERDHSYFFFR